VVDYEISRKLVDNTKPPPLSPTYRFLYPSKYHFYFTASTPNLSATTLSLLICYLHFTNFKTYNHFYHFSFLFSNLKIKLNGRKILLNLEVKEI